jgi:hypothetical protein
MSFPPEKPNPPTRTGLRTVVRLAAVAAIGFGLWLLLVPRTVNYKLDENNEPVDVVTTYTWGSDADNKVVLWAGAWPDDVTEDGNDHLFIHSVRVGCGSVFTGADGNSTSTLAACSQVETMPLAGGIALVLSGAAGLGLARRIQSSPAQESVRGDATLFRADDLPAVDHPVLGEDPDSERT